MMPTKFPWNKQVKEVTGKYDVPKRDYKPNAAEWTIISSSEYSFYSAWFNRPDTATRIQKMQLNEDSWLENVIGGIANATLTDWICELVQNAFDQCAETCELTIDKVEGRLTFRHDGREIRGPSKQGQYVGDVGALMEVGISLKSFDLKSEGRYGVGFKYWKQHFEEASLSSGGLTMSWNNDWEISDIDKIKPSKWTEFNFCRYKGDTPLDMDTSSLERLRNAIRMIPRDFEMKARTIYSDREESFSWKHKITKETDFGGMKLLSFKDDYDDLNQVLETTLMPIKMNSPVFSSDIIEEIRASFSNAIEDLNKRRKKVQGSHDPIDIQKAVDKHFSDSPLVLGVFHEDDAKGQLLSLFPISDEGKSESRISFDAPFDIKPDRLNLKDDKKDGEPERNRILIKMLLISYGNLLKAIQSLPGFFPQDLIEDLLNNPPGCGQDFPLDEKIQDFSMHKSHYDKDDWDYESIWNDPPDTQVDAPSDLLGVECWPLSDGTLMKASDDAKPLDRDLADFILGADPGDAVWANKRLEDDAIVYSGGPVWNWILEKQSKLIGFSGISIDVPDDWPVPPSLLNHLTQQKNWPDWLPTITLGLDGQDVAEWDAKTQVAFLLDGADKSLDTENSDLKGIIENEGQTVVMLAKELKPIFDSLGDAARTNVPAGDFHRAGDLDSHNEIRRALLTHVFEDPDTFPDDSLRSHVGKHNQKDRYPILVERMDLEDKPLLLVPEPGKFWESARLNVTQGAGKLWFPSHTRMRDSTAVISVPPSAQGHSKTGDDILSFYPLKNDDGSLTVARRPDTRTPNVIHWDHDFHPPELKDAMDLAIQHLRDSNFINRNPIQLAGQDDAEIGLLRIIAPDTKRLCEEMVEGKAALKLPRLLNTCYMPRKALIKSGKEDDNGDSGEIWTHGSDDWHSLKPEYASFEPTLPTPEQEWLNHLANVTNPRDPIEIRGMGEINDPSSGFNDIWEARLDDEGDPGRINYGVLCRDIRLDHAIMESARGNQAHLKVALEVSSGCLSRINGEKKVWLFEGYWSKVTGSKFKREFRADRIETTYNPNLLSTSTRYVESHPRVSTTGGSSQHPHFSDLSDKGVLGFHISTTKIGGAWEIGYLNDHWVPCTHPPSPQLKQALDDEGLYLVRVSKEAFEWSMKANIRGTPWKNRLKTLCNIAISSPIIQQKELLKLVDSMLYKEHQRTSPGNSSSACRQLLKSLDESIIDGFLYLKNLMSGTTRTLVEVIQEVNQDPSLVGNDLIDLFDNISCCNWIFDSTSSQFKASDQLGLGGRSIWIISHKDAQMLFNMPSRISPMKASDGEWESNRYALDDGAEIVIMEGKLRDRLVAAGSQLEEIKAPELDINRMKAQARTPQSLRFINSLIRLTQMREKMYESLGDFELYLENRPRLTIINKPEAAQASIPLTNGILSVGSGGWLLDSGSNHLVYGGLGIVPSEESIDLLKNLLSQHRTLRTDIIETSTKNPKKAIISYQNLIPSAFDNKQRAELTVSHMDKEAPNPWCNRDEYFSQFLLSDPQGELKRQKSDWSNSKTASDFYRNKKDSYLNQLQSGSISISQQNRRMLEAMYDGRPCIIEGIIPIVTDSDDILGSTIRPRQKVTISQDMIGGHPYHDDAEMYLTDGLLGNTILVSGAAAEKLRRTLDEDRFDFAANFIDLLIDTIGGIQWNRNDDFVLVDGAFVNSITGDRVGIHLHKLHLLHIAALYSAISEMVL